MPDDCMRWSGPHRKQDDRPVHKKRYVYRTLWEEANGPLPTDQILHHLCHNKWCINLDHIEPMIQADHLREHGLSGDWGQANKTHCPSGHEYTEENTYNYVRKDGRKERHCKVCVREAKRRYRAKTLAGKH